MLVLGFNYSIEFTGGTLVQVTTPRTGGRGEDPRRPRRATACAAPRSSSSARPQLVTIRARVQDAANEAAADNTELTTSAVRAALDASLGADQYKVESEGGRRPQGGRRAAHAGAAWRS